MARLEVLEKWNVNYSPDESLAQNKTSAGLIKLLKRRFQYVNDSVDMGQGVKGYLSFLHCLRFIEHYLEVPFCCGRVIPGLAHQG